MVVPSSNFVDFIHFANIAAKSFLLSEVDNDKCSLLASNAISLLYKKPLIANSVPV